MLNPTRHLKETAMLFLIIFLSWTNGFTQQKAGLQELQENTSLGYTLFAPLGDTITYLINNCGIVVHQWHSPNLPANEVKLLPNGLLLRCEKLDNPTIEAGGGGGLVRLYDNDSQIVWSYTLNNDTIRQHHDATYLPNGNILILAWKWHSFDDAIQAGRNPDNLNDSTLWSEMVLEVQPEYPEGGTIVWQWDSWDHHVQDIDASKDNFGSVSDTGKININFNSGNGQEDWIHANGIDYNASLDQILISSRTLSEVWVIDHSTTTEEASSTTGGNYEQGGAILYRWGNPAAYDAGTLSDQQLFNQHNPNWVKGTSEIIVFNNNNYSTEESKFYSSVVIIDPSLGEDGYEKAGSRFLPETPSFEYKSDQFLSRFISGAEVLDNGHILICSGAQGWIFEINDQKEVVWSYINPVSNEGIYNRTVFISPDEDFKRNTVFRAHKYPSEYPGLTSLPLTPTEPIEGGNWYTPGNCLITGLASVSSDEIRIYPNPALSEIKISITGKSVIPYVIMSIEGNEVLRGHYLGGESIDIRGLNRGAYIFISEDLRKVFIKN